MKSDTINAAVSAILGQVTLGSHVIEDLLRLHLFEAGRFRVRGVRESTVREMQQRTLEDVIAEFGRMYPEHPALREAFDLLRQIRNKVIHALLSDVGHDLLSVEGQDQVHALLSEIAALQMRYLRPLQRLHQDLIRKVCKDSFMDVMQKTNDW